MSSLKLFALAVIFSATGCLDTQDGTGTQYVACDPTLQCDPDDAGTDGACPCDMPVVPPTCTLNVAYASATANIIGIISDTVCNPPLGYTGSLSYAYPGQTVSLGNVNPVCGRQARESIGLTFGTCNTAVFTLTIKDSQGAPITSCSSTLVVRQ